MLGRNFDHFLGVYIRWVRVFVAHDGEPFVRATLAAAEGRIDKRERGGGGRREALVHGWRTTILSPLSESIDCLRNISRL